VQLLPLAYYKYANFALNDVFGLGIPGLSSLLIPVGISFYSFQMVGFVIDTLHYNQPLPKFLDFLNFASFFPQVVAGPIERRAELLPQIQEFRFQWLPGQIDEGVKYVVLGLFFKMCLADNIAAQFDASSVTNPFLIWYANVLFGFRIYFDFAGYSLVAVGLGRCLGIGLTMNFRSPYISTSATEFWRRWHVTLSQWFRDYLYIPLGGNRAGMWSFNILLVFVVSGIWHGAGWNFVIWGALHGCFLLINRRFGSRLKLPPAAAWLLTMLCAFFAWMSFYETRTPALIQKTVTILNPAQYSSAHLKEAVARWSDPMQGGVLAFLALAGVVLLIEWLSERRCGRPYALFLKPSACVILVILTVLLNATSSNAFIYFAF
jgi:D-alanyl-lipoteichoic acid acyltransferase DltB (MBOAT superfamily)